MPEPKKAKSSPEFPPLFQDGTFRMTPEQHLAAAAQLRRRGEAGDRKAAELAVYHEQLAEITGKRREAPAPPLAPA
jgi:hypothetical protein